jgi:hypothetical protein
MGFWNTILGFFVGAWFSKSGIHVLKFGLWPLKLIAFLSLLKKTNFARSYVKASNICPPQNEITMMRKVLFVALISMGYNIIIAQTGPARITPNKQAVKPGY